MLHVPFWYSSHVGCIQMDRCRPRHLSEHDLTWKPNEMGIYTYGRRHCGVTRKTITGRRQEIRFFQFFRLLMVCWADVFISFDQSFNQKNPHTPVFGIWIHSSFRKTRMELVCACLARLDISLTSLARPTPTYRRVIFLIEWIHLNRVNTMSGWYFIQHQVTSLSFIKPSQFSNQTRYFILQKWWR